MELRTIPVGPLQANCYVLWENPEAAIVVDPGAEGERILKELEKEGVTPALVVITHGHFDHTGAVADVVKEHAVPFKHHAAEAEIVAQTPAGTRMWGIEVSHVPEPSGHVADGEKIELDGLRVDVIHTPGHTPGSVCFHVPDEGLLLTGDTLFQRSVGRSDFPGGDQSALFDSIRGKLYTLDEATRVLPGHGPETTIREERDENPFVQA